MREGTPRCMLEWAGSGAETVRMLGTVGLVYGGNGASALLASRRTYR